MTDVADLARKREEEIRQDALADHARRTQREPGEIALICVECGEEIQEERRQATHGVQTCIECQKDAEHRDWLARRRGRGAI